MANSPAIMAPPLSTAAIALNRFGLGARADEAPPANPKNWLLAQIDAYQPMPAAWAAQPTSLAIAADLADERQQAMANPATNATASGANAASAPNLASNPDDARKAARQAANKAQRMETRDTYRAAVNARVASALTTPAPFIERLVHFWSNHFAVSIDKGRVAPFAGAFEAEAIRPHVLGRFEDMLVAVERHPAMQLFLDQTRSVGPDSVAALRAAQRNPNRKPGLNENLAREIMELHTLGVRSGYTQDDVTEFARAMTGWSIAAAQGPQANNASNAKNVNTAPPGAFMFRPQLHEPGTRTIMGRRYDQPGEGQTLAVLHDLSSAPATATHIATKLARHFVADNPSPDVVDQLATAFMRSRGDLPTVYRALIDSDAAWSPIAVKFKSPWEWTVSSMRGLGMHNLNDRERVVQMAPVLTQLGQQVWRPGSPAGYDDIAASWAAPDALVRRVEIAQRFAARVGDRLDARSLGQTLTAGSLSEPTQLAVSRAESASTALALLLVSPDFQRR
ncbi:DUF1800 domain-containing protein [Paraburkholderia hospita]|uniref:DUF1800 domain-containing protein n=1 Tax=Paraburkholderia hospita TaxID=169430 RepID=A0AAN1JAG6_9BURK|nr:DUF1800 domain-containing protein [Paraburkholderia hospita]AUT70430.1 DUF1800 domain-containing protein [Paraburkholderia hospita]EIM99874.1 hypothetical protein WQE_17384 [Paraburkholderia hospita]OUL85999.1 hypothetical protein CA602_16935 [Paraburkholderia hospita]OUL88296.1 hypothetical protein CA601_19015 [Paraburkholderia hospita]SEH54184.1 Uncharacterized conserved protein, DUF1800 family [Paraburkholderia hospita]